MNLSPVDKMVADALAKRLRDAFPDGVTIGYENGPEWRVAFMDGDPDGPVSVEYEFYDECLPDALARAAEYSAALRARK